MFSEGLNGVGSVFVVLLILVMVLGFFLIPSNEPVKFEKFVYEHKVYLCPKGFNFNEDNLTCTKTYKAVLSK